MVKMVSREYEISLSYKSIKEVLELFTELEDRFGPDAEIGVDSYQEYDSNLYRIYVMYKSEQTPAEIKDEATRLKRSEDYQRQQYESLKAKFG